MSEARQSGLRTESQPVSILKTLCEEYNMVTEGICPTCGKKNVPRGMHCRECLCDILCSHPIGTTRRFILDNRNRKRRPTPPKSIAEIYQFTA